jgi:hypothetical protein
MSEKGKTGEIRKTHIENERVNLERKSEERKRILGRKSEVTEGEIEGERGGERENTR